MPAEVMVKESDIPREGLTARERGRIASILSRAAWLYRRLDELPDARAANWRARELSAIYWLLWIAFGSNAETWWHELLKRPTPEEGKTT